MMKCDFDGRVVLVTGAGKGIGRATCLALIEGGGSVVAVSRTASDLEDLSEEVQKKGYPSTCITCITADLSTDAGVSLTCDSISSYKVTDLVNNAGVACVHMIKDFTSHHMLEAFKVNLFAPFLITQAFVKYRHQLYSPSSSSSDTGPSFYHPCGVVNVSSQASLVSVSGESLYSSTKAGLDALTRGLAAEEGCTGLRCNSVNPTVVLTKLGAEIWGGENEKKPKSQMMLSRLPDQTFAQEADVVHAILFLLSNTKGGGVNGVSLPVDKGVTACIIPQHANPEASSTVTPPSTTNGSTPQCGTTSHFFKQLVSK